MKLPTLLAPAKPPTAVAAHVNPQEELDRVLQGMAQGIPGLRAVVIGDSNGLPLASVSNGTRSIAATAVATLIVTAAKDLTAILEFSAFSDVLVEGHDWKVFVRLLRNNFTFMGVMDGDANLGLVRIELDRRCREVEAVLDSFR